MADIFAAGALVQGMFFPELHQDYHIRFGLVLGWYCPDHPNTVFPGPECSLCDQEGKRTVFEEAHHERHAKKRLLDERLYQKADYWKCQLCEKEHNHENYYPEKEPVCPLCGKGRIRGAARSLVWVRSRDLRLPAECAGPNAWGPELDPEEVWAFKGTVEDAVISEIDRNRLLSILDPIERDVWMKLHAGYSKTEIAQEFGMPQRDLERVIRTITKKRKAFQD